MDAIDRRILAILQDDASLSNVELARRVHLSPSPCLARVKALEKAGVIRGHVALLDPKALGLNLNVFISISLKQQTRDALEAFLGHSEPPLDRFRLSFDVLEVYAGSAGISAGCTGRRRASAGRR